MAKKQRGKSSLSTDIKTQTEHLHVGAGSSEDEAPEEVTFEDSKAQALRSVKAALDSVRREKELLKERRRKRQELFQEQKKRKLLPVNVLEEIDSKEQRQSEDEAGEEEEESRKKKKKTMTGKMARKRNLNGNYTVTTVKDRGSVSVQQQAAQDFIQSRLYGPGSCRTTNNELLSLQNKKGTNKSAAVQFLKRGGAWKQTLKKRRLHKQHVSS